MVPVRVWAGRMVPPSVSVGEVTAPGIFARVEVILPGLVVLIIPDQDGVCAGLQQLMIDLLASRNGL